MKNLNLNDAELRLLNRSLITYDEKLKDIVKELSILNYYGVITDDDLIICNKIINESEAVELLYKKIYF